MCQQQLARTWAPSLHSPERVTVVPTVPNAGAIPVILGRSMSAHVRSGGPACGV